MSAENTNIRYPGDRLLRLLEQFVEAFLFPAKWLALPIVTLLFLQWPLRTIVGLYSREANDLGQWLFALYVASACFGTTIGALSVDVPIQLLSALPERLINLLDNDLLQAIPLYVLMGALITRLPLADAVYRCCLAILPGRAAPAVRECRRPQPETARYFEQ